MAEKTALITGASSGIGAAFARSLAAQGYDLILTGRRAEKLEALAEELRRQHAVQVEVLISDLSQPEGIAALEEKIQTCSSLALLVNNAGFGVLGQFAESEIQPNLDMITVHVNATVRLTRAALPGMIARGTGAVINVSSLAAFLPFGGSSVIYPATKAFLNAFSQALQDELRGTGVKVQALCPGFTHTDFHARPMLKGFEQVKIPAMAWMDADQVVSASLRGLERGQVIVVPGILNQLMATFGNNPLVRAIAHWARQR